MALRALFDSNDGCVATFSDGVGAVGTANCWFQTRHFGKIKAVDLFCDTAALTGVAGGTSQLTVAFSKSIPRPITGCSSGAYVDGGGSDHIGVAVLEPGSCQLQFWANLFTGANTLYGWQMTFMSEASA